MCAQVAAWISAANGSSTVPDLWGASADTSECHCCSSELQMCSHGSLKVKWSELLYFSRKINPNLSAESKAFPGLLSAFLLYQNLQKTSEIWSKDHWAPLRSGGDEAESEELNFMTNPAWWKAWYPLMGFFFPKPIHSNVKARKGNSHGNLRSTWRWWCSLIKTCKFLEIKRCWPQRERRLEHVTKSKVGLEKKQHRFLVLNRY